MFIDKATREKLKAMSFELYGITSAYRRMIEEGYYEDELTAENAQKYPTLNRRTKAPNIVKINKQYTVETLIATLERRLLNKRAEETALAEATARRAAAKAAEQVAKESGDLFLAENAKQMEEQSK